MVLLLQSITGALHKLNVTNELTVEELERYCSDVFLQTDVNKDEKVRLWQCMVFRPRHRSPASRAAAQITFDEFSQWALMSVKSQELIHSFKSTHASMVSSASSQDMSAKQTPRRPKTTGKKRRNGRGKSSDHRRPRSSAGGKQDSSSRDDGSAKARSRHRGDHSARSHGSPAAGGLPSLSAGSGGGYYSDDEEKLARAQKAKAQRIRDSASRGRSSGGLGATRPTREDVDVDVVAPTRRSRSQGPKRRERSAASNRRSKSKDTGDKQPSAVTPVKKRARRKEKTPKRPETPDYAAQGLQKQMMRTRAAKLHTIATRELLRELVDVTAFSFSELNELVHHFTDVSDVRGMHVPGSVTPRISLVVCEKVTGALRISLFEDIIEEHLPGLQQADLSGKLYRLMDADASGTISFAEFCVGLSVVMRGTMDEKLRIMFQIHDHDSAYAHVSRAHSGRAAGAHCDRVLLGHRRQRRDGGDGVDAAY